MDLEGEEFRYRKRTRLLHDALEHRIGMRVALGFEEPADGHGGVEHPDHFS